MMLKGTHPLNNTLVINGHPETNAAVVSLVCQCSSNATNWNASVGHCVTLVGSRQREVWLDVTIHNLVDR